MPASPEQQRAVAERRARVVELAAAGVDYGEIARRVGLPSRHAVVVDLRRAAGRPPGPPLPLAPCGTWSAYKRHRKRGEPVDEACQAAARAQSASRYVPSPYKPGAPRPLSPRPARRG